MPGTSVIDVVIGLVFIYLLYSLLATVIAEIVSNSFQLRASVLEKSIRRMLMDEDKSLWENLTFYFKRFWKRILRNIAFIRGATAYRKVSSPKNMIELFYAHPSIKYLGKSNVRRRPSYLKSSTFSKALMELLNMGRGESDMERVKDSLEHGVVDKAGHSTSDKEQEGKRISICEETSEQLHSFYKEASGDAEKFKASLEHWFEEVQERCVGWYKRKIQFVLFIIGFIMAVFFNVDTIEITERLSNDKSARDAMVKLASSYDINDKLDGLDKSQRDSIINLSIALKLKADSMITNDVNKANEVLALGWGIPDSVLIGGTSDKPKCVTCDSCRVKCAPEKCQGTYDNKSCMCSIQVNDSTFQRKKLTKRSKGYCDAALVAVASDKLCSNEAKPYWYTLKWHDKIEYIYHKSKESNSKFVGFIITALAISLGSPFWFDLLNKLMKLRASVPQKNEQKKIAEKASVSPVNRIG